jgi:hypothetical protein
MWEAARVGLPVAVAVVLLVVDSGAVLESAAAVDGDKPLRSSKKQKTGSRSKWPRRLFCYGWALCFNKVIGPHDRLQNPAAFH